jgi:naphthalene 1,2-dioxygenase system ferredoxin subunit
MAEGTWVKVASKASLGAGAIASADIGGRSVAVYNVDGEFYATDNICTHAFAMLSDGWLDGDVIECPLHAGRFEVKTGKGLGPPIDCDIETFPVRVVGDDIEVLLPPGK